MAHSGMVLISPCWHYSRNFTGLGSHRIRAYFGICDGLKLSLPWRRKGVFQMENSFESSSNSKSPDRVNGEDQLVESIGQVWIPHQNRDLEIRYEVGRLLNDKLGNPSIRQSFGLGTIRRISAELEIDKSDISRMRRFAGKFESFDHFQTCCPNVKNWTAVRTILSDDTAKSETPMDRRGTWALLRSVRSAVKAFGRGGEFTGPSADELRETLQELFEIAEQRLDMRFDKGNHNRG